MLLMFFGPMPFSVIAHDLEIAEFVVACLERHGQAAAPRNGIRPFARGSASFRRARLNSDDEAVEVGHVRPSLPRPIPARFR